MTKNVTLMLILIFSHSGCIIKQKAASITESKALRYAKVTKPIQGMMIEKAAFVGFVEPRLLLSLHFLLPGRIDKCLVKEGDPVKQGQEICRLDLSAIKLEVSRAENAVKAAKRVMETNLPEKQKALFEAGMIGQAEFEQVRIQSESAKAQYADATSLHEIAIKKQTEHILVAPWDGTLTRLFAKAGQPIVPEMPAALLSDEKTMQIASELHASYFSKIEIGTKGILRTVSSKKLETPFELRVVEKAIAITPESQSFRIVLKPKENYAKLNLVPGVLVTGNIILHQEEHAMKIPQSSLTQWSNDGNASIYIIENNTLKKVEITTGIIDDGFIEVTSGLDMTKDVVVEPASDFSSGLSVQSN